MAHTFICKTAALNNGDCLSFDLAGTACFVTNKEGAFYAYQNACPHLGVNMEWQANQFLDSDKELIQCSMHGALFVIESGDCVYGPCQGKSLKPINVEERDGELFALSSN